MRLPPSWLPCRLSCILLSFISVWLHAAPTGDRCRTPAPQRSAIIGDGDCPINRHTVNPENDPVLEYRIPVVVHILMDDACSLGRVDDAQVHAQMRVINEDFRALANSNGALGEDSRISFVLADRDPEGRPTSGITRTCRTAAHTGSPVARGELMWAPRFYLNLFVFDIEDAAGFVNFFPSQDNGALVGSSSDLVAVDYQNFGVFDRGEGLDHGRTATHEIGHYLGLDHTFYPEFDCPIGDVPDCYTQGDLLCDTPSERYAFRGGCDGDIEASCGQTSRPYDNYMNYSDDLCMTRFTPEQINRMRCSLRRYRPNLYQVADDACGETPFSLTLTTGSPTCGGESFAVAANFDGDVVVDSVSWSPPDLFRAPRFAETLATLQRTTEIRVQVRDIRGCTVEASTLITVVPAPDEGMYAAWRERGTFLPYDADADQSTTVLDYTAIVGFCR